MKTKTVDWQRFLDTEKRSKEALRLASKHDPDLEKRIVVCERCETRLINHMNREIGVAGKIPLHQRLDIIERQLERLGAPQYRTARKGK
jgi:hypothetical protein